MTQEETWMLDRIWATAKRAMADMDRPPSRFKITKDGAMEPIEYDSRLSQRARQAQTLFQNYRVLVDGADSLFYAMAISRARKQYLQGRLKPSAMVAAAVRNEAADMVAAGMALGAAGAILASM